METKWTKWYAMTSHVIAYRSLELLFSTHTFHFNCVFTQIRCLSRVLVLCPGAPKGSTGSGSNIKHLRRWGHSLKSHPKRLGEPGIELRTLWYKASGLSTTPPVKMCLDAHYDTSFKYQQHMFSKWLRNEKIDF